ncbi:DUF2304 domain-containing protein [Planosporangium sp. 12N6]|uniref:DUF2304 domain-containing protein n=1 Tax=Planosporangium spinosum TaxID=3402278 RepID=UPI003CF001F5
MKLNVLTAIVGLALLFVIFELLRRRQLREKYAVLWIVVGIGVVPLAVFPRGLDSFARLIGIASGASLVLFLGLLLLLLISTHLSWEVSRLEEETRTLAEEVALIRTRLAELDSRELSHDER